MYKLMVPVMGFSEGLAKELIRAGTDEVLVVFPRVLRNAAMLGEKIQDFLKAKEYFEGCGIKTGAWLVPSIGYGGTGEPSYKMYDMILRADGATDGILKYMTDYVSNIHFEPGYIDRHVANGQRYKEIEKRFSGKTTVGLDIIEKTDTFRKMDFSKDVSFSEYGSRGYLPTMSQWFLCDNSIPTAYGRHGCAHIAFGVNAEYLTEQNLADGIITDAQGAEILMRKGIDVGIKAAKKADVPSFEYFIPEDDFTYADTDRPGKFYEYTLDEKATVMSEFIRVDVSGLLPDTDSMRKSDKRFSACHIYENAARQRFMIYSFVPHSVYVTSGWHRGLFRNYYRQKQLAKGIEFLQKRPLPAMCFDAPELYILCKKSEGEMSIGLWNIYPDSVLKPETYCGAAPPAFQPSTVLSYCIRKAVPDASSAPS